jgi:uncharacterized protein (DUF169 family)
MKPLQTDLSVFEKIGFDKPPVGVKFLFYRPPGIQQMPLEKSFSFCEMLKEAQDTTEPFYFSSENNETCVGKILLGIEEMVPFAESGQIGEKLGVFQEARANYAFYQYVPKFSKGIVNYVAFSRIDRLTYEPDVLIIAARPSQGEIIMRAMTYSTGELYVSKTTPVMGCAWFYIYPFQSGKVNYVMPDLVHGMKGRELFPEGTMLISIPHHWLPTVTRNLQEMEMHLPSHTGRENYLKELGRIFDELAQENEKA